MKQDAILTLTQKGNGWLTFSRHLFNRNEVIRVPLGVAMIRKSCLLLFLAVSCFVQAMNGIAQIGYGAKARGMGGVGIAYPQDSLAIATNPAGLVYVCDRLDAGIHWLRQEAEFDAFPGYVPGFEGQQPFDDKTQGAYDPTNLHFKSGRNLIWPEIGINWRFCPNQALGAALFGFGGFDTLYNPIFQGLGKTNTGMEYKQFFVSPAWAFRCGYHSFGVAFNVCFAWTSIKGLEDLVGPSLEHFPPPKEDETKEAKESGESTSSETSEIQQVAARKSSSSTPTHATNRGTDHEEGVSLRFGYLFRLPCSLAVGITYQTPTWVNRFKNYKGFLAGQGDLNLPAQLGVGISYCLFNRLVVAVDAVEWFWTNSAQFRNHYKENEPFGKNGASGFGWKDQTVFKVGLAYCLNRCFTVRAGYNYGSLPFNADDLFLNILPAALVREHVTAGATLRWGCNEFTVDYVQGFRTTLRNDLLERTVSRLSGTQYSIGAGYARIF